VTHLDLDDGDMSGPELVPAALEAAHALPETLEPSRPALATAQAEQRLLPSRRGVP
jgi:hypothetical protein